MTGANPYRARRVALELTQAELAELADVDRSTVSKLERDLISSDAASACAVARTLKAVEVAAVGLDVLSTPGQRLHALRERLDLSQAALARRVDLRRSTISRYERDLVNRPRHLRDVARALGVQLRLITGEDR